MEGNEPLISRRYRRVSQPTGLKASFHYHPLECFPYRFHGQDILPEGLPPPRRKLPTLAEAPSIWGSQLGSGYDYLQNYRMFCYIVGGVPFQLLHKR